MEEQQETKTDTADIEAVAKYWNNRGFVGMALANKIIDTMERGELVDDGNDSCKVCEQLWLRKQKQTQQEPAEKKSLQIMG